MATLHTYDVIVIGLGISGTTALAQLARGGLSVLGLEATDRVGGRVKTVEFGDGVVELGAEWIHGTVNNRIYDIVLSVDQPVAPQDLTFRVYRSDGTRGDDALVNSLVDYCVGGLWNPNAEAAEGLGDYVPCDDALVNSLMDYCAGGLWSPNAEQAGLGDYVVRECNKYIQANHPGLLKDTDFITEFYEFANLLMNNYESSNDWNDVTTSSTYEDLDGEQHMSWQRQGFKTLFDIVLNKHNNGPGIPGADMQFNKPVTQIKWSKNPAEPVLVSCADGHQYRAKTVLVTVSVGVLKERHMKLFDPPLPEHKVEAIETLSIGVMDKIILSFAAPWWSEGESFIGFIWRTEDKVRVPAEDYWTTRIFGASPPRGAGNALTLWTSGEVAKLVETLPEDVVKRKAVDLLRRFIGDKVTEPTGMIRSTWYSNPYTRGSYTFDNRMRHQHPRARTYLAEPVLDSANRPKLLFAGEATNETHFSTVHGAYETGVREASRLLGVKSKI
ncbi:possible lysine-specific histone demethylase 1 [Plutella xylostella]|uniref:possible lysine-specific histone demethylase 1 n=1 Tax=Plutella xylostella TaxID=51655 RepID=UPI00203309CB|nr:possible lysine-specific histone demethylase 1 [Plutella xylostella]